MLSTAALLPALAGPLAWSWLTVPGWVRSSTGWRQITGTCVIRWDRYETTVSVAFADDDTAELLVWGGPIPDALTVRELVADLERWHRDERTEWEVV